MLILRRKSGESIVIGEDIRVTVLDINEGSVRLAIDAPKVIPILRSELLQAADANRDSAVTEQAQSRNLLRFLGGNAGPEHADAPAKANRPRAVRPGSVSRPFSDAPASTSAQGAETSPDAQAGNVSPSAETVEASPDA